MANVSADPIGEFYTSHPYPPPLENLDRAREMWQDVNVHRAEHHLYWPHKEYRADIDVLVAGCGTWQAAKYALCHPDARVVAIDISTTSLDHTGRLKQKYDLNNLEIRQLAIESAHDLDQQFDMIISTGVLHHLVDPDAGLRSLTPLLKPDGAMYLMLYGRYGRTGVLMLQDYCRRLGVGTSEQEIRDLAATLSVLPQQHPFLMMMRGSRDGGMNVQNLVDAALNPRDRVYSVPELFDFIERNDLMLTRWYFQAPYSPRCGQIQQTPHASRLLALSERDQYAQMELWRGMMVNHDIVVHPATDKDRLKVSFDDDRHLQYVPIRRAWTMCVQHNLPPGAAGVLLNQANVFPDIYLPVNSLEKGIYDAIDGRRSISEIVEAVKDPAAPPLAAAFFEKLWWYDLTVFDTSRAQ